MPANRRNIEIVPHLGSTAVGLESFMQFIGATSGEIKLYVEDDSTINFVGASHGVLFSIADSKEGIIHSVNDISGNPMFGVYDTGLIFGGRLNRNDWIVTPNGNMGVGVTGATADLAKFIVNGNARFMGGQPIFVGPSASNTSIHGATGGVLVTKDWVQSVVGTTSQNYNRTNITTGLSGSTAIANTIDGFNSSATHIVEVSVGASASGNYGAWKRSLVITTSGATPTIRNENVDLDVQSGFNPEHVDFVIDGINVNVIVKSAAGGTTSWSSSFKILEATS